MAPSLWPLGPQNRSLTPLNSSSPRGLFLAMKGMSHFLQIRYTQTWPNTKHTAEPNSPQEPIRLCIIRNKAGVQEDVHGGVKCTPELGHSMQTRKKDVSLIMLDVLWFEMIFWKNWVK